jgi:hypothetical protein
MNRFSDGEIIKLCLETVHIIPKIILPRFTVGRRIENLSNNIKQSLKMKAGIFNGFSIAVNKSTDVSATEQLGCFLSWKGHGLPYN